MSLDPLAIAHLGIGRRPIVAALLGLWDELMAILAAPALPGPSVMSRAWEREHYAALAGLAAEARVRQARRRRRREEEGALVSLFA